MINPVLSLNDIHKSFHQGDTDLEVLKGISLTIAKGEMVSLIGPSGSGKSTLLHIAGLLELSDTGAVTVLGEDVTRSSDKKRTQMRRKHLGFVYQYHHLLPDLSALENVTLPQMIAGKQKQKAQKKAEELLEKFGLKERAKHRPGELSGGEQQRVAIARALANEPSLLLADEPTGNLDPETSDNVFNVMLEYVKVTGLSLLLVTHERDLAQRTDRVFSFHNGVLTKL